MFKDKFLNNGDIEDDFEEAEDDSKDDEYSYGKDNEAYEDDGDWDGTQKIKAHARLILGKISGNFYHIFGAIILLMLIAGGIWLLLGNASTEPKLQNPDLKSGKRITEKKEPKEIESDIHKPIQEEPTVPSAPSGDGKFTGKEIFEKYNSAVFVVYTAQKERSKEKKQGSGFFVNSSGLAVSNYHVFAGTKWWQVRLSNGQSYNIAKIIAQSKKDDYIVFKVDLGFKCNYIPVTNRKPVIGEKVFAFGSPLGYSNTLSDGIISQLREHENHIQHNAATDHGSSGGALINEYGEVIGITTSKVSGTSASLNFAKDISILKDKLDLGY